MRGGSTDDYTMSDDDAAGGFVYYEITTTDPGPFLLLGTVAFSIFLYSMLPCMVACGKSREKRRLQRAQAQAQEGCSGGAGAVAEVNGLLDGSSSVGGDGNPQQPDQHEEQEHDEIASSPAVTKKSKWKRRTKRGASPAIHHHHHGGAHDDDDLSVASSRSSTSRFVTDVLKGVKQTHHMGARRMHLEKRMRRMENASTHHFVPENMISSSRSMFPSPSSLELQPAVQQQLRHNGAAGGDHQHEDNNNNKFVATFADDEEVVPSFGNAYQGFGGYDHHDHDHVAARTPVSRRDGLIKARLASKNNVRYKPPRNIASAGCMSYVARAWDALLQVVEWDYENRRIMKLACPYIVQALVGGIAEATRVAVVGRFYGTRELSAYVIVDALVGLTMGVVGGINSASGVLIAQTIGSGQTKLTGQYVQIGITCYIICIIPFSIGWTFAIGPTLDFMGFDPATVQIGVDFTMIYVWSQAIRGLSNGILLILDITDHEIFGTYYAIVNEVSVTLMMLLLAILSKEPATLVDVSYYMISIRFLNVVLVVLIVWCKGWWRKYYSGMIYSCGILNFNATKTHVSTSIPLSFGYLLAYGEWEILTFFAAFLGPAEVSAWGVLGTVWDVLEETTEAVAEAGEVRCAFLLGAGRPYHAAMSAAKSTVFAFIFAVLLACIVLICGDNLAVWMTSDPTLQKLVADLIPLFALGNVALTVGTMAWTLVGAQGRYALSTSVGFVGSWCVTIPMAAMYTIWLEVSLQGQTSAVVIGYMVSGICNTYILFMSDWKAISDKVVAHNAANGIDLDSDQESSGDGDSSDSSISSADE